MPTFLKFPAYHKNM